MGISIPKNIITESLSLSILLYKRYSNKFSF